MAARDVVEIDCTNDMPAMLSRLGEACTRFGIAQVIDATSCDRLGLPVCVAIRPAGRVATLTEGNHETTSGAMIGAIMEAVETAIGESLPMPRRKTSFATLSQTQPVIDVPRLPFKDGKVFDPDRRVAWCKGTRLGSRQACLAPFEAVALHPVIDAENTIGLNDGSSGLAAGGSIADASYRALLEMIERDSLARWFTASPMHRLRSRFLPASSASNGLSDLLEICQQQRVMPAFWRITNSMAVPTVFCQLFDLGAGRGEIVGYATGSASDVTWIAACRRALMEAIQTRIALLLRGHEIAAKAARLRQQSLEIARAQLAAAGPMPRDPRGLQLADAPGRLKELVRRIIQKRGVEPVMVPLTPRTAFPAVVRVIAPGFRRLR